MKTVLDLSCAQAREFFLNKECYCNINLPAYFDFQALLNDLDKYFELGEKATFNDMLFKCCQKLPVNYSNVNYTIYYNKDNYYAWRPLQLPNPVLYVMLTRYITQENIWKLIKKRFKKFSKDKNILCKSIPVVKDGYFKKQQAKQILSWWEEVEQLSITQSLEFSYVYATDITDCYASLFMQTIILALCGNKTAKNKQYNVAEGDNIVFLLQQMTNGRTNGLPQGSVLTDFIAEIVLGYSDMILSEKIRSIAHIEDFKIVRYRDDYKIFVNDPQDGNRIMKLLTETMIELGLKLNAAKTIAFDDVIEASIKKDKLYCFIHLQDLEGKFCHSENLQKQLFKIYSFSKEFPNSGSLQKLLMIYNRKIKFRNYDNNILPIISLALKIALDNPRVYPIGMAIISKVLFYIPLNNRKEIILQIFNKVRKKLNSEYYEIWLQRMAFGTSFDLEYHSNICKFVNNESNISLWNIDWAKSNIKEIFKKNTIINKELISNLCPAIFDYEISPFYY